MLFISSKLMCLLCILLPYHLIALVCNLCNTSVGTVQHGLEITWKISTLWIICLPVISSWKSKMQQCSSINSIIYSIPVWSIYILSMALATAVARKYAPGQTGLNRAAYDRILLDIQFRTMSVVFYLIDFLLSATVVLLWAS